MLSEPPPPEDGEDEGELLLGVDDEAGVVEDPDELDEESLLFVSLLFVSEELPLFFESLDSLESFDSFEPELPDLA